MIFSNLITSFLQLIFKPKVWIPLIGMLIISTAMTLMMSVVLERPMIDIILYPETFPSESILGVFLTQYPFEILFSVILAFVMTTLGVVAFISTSKISQGEKLVKAINSSVMEIRKAFGIALVTWGAILFALFGFTIVGVITGINDFVGFILFIILLVIIFVVLVKTIFVIPALNKNEVKEAFKESWKFTQKRFWKALLFVLLSLIISILLGVIIYSAGLIVAGTIFELIVLTISETSTSLYFIVAITNYFYSKQ